MIETAVIFCGGAGTRLLPLTQDVPKSLLSINDEFTILSYQLMQLKSAGVRDVYLLAGDKGLKISSFAAMNQSADMTIHTIIESESIGTTAALAGAIQLIGDNPFILMNGDIVADINFRDMYYALEDSDKPALIYLTRLKSPYGIVSESIPGTVDKFEEKPTLDMWINGGIYLFKENFLTDAKTWYFESTNIEDKLLPTLADTDNLASYKNYDNLFWMSIDSMKDLNVVRSEFSNRIFKPWGYEKIIDDDSDITHKELFIFESEATSLHYHKEKTERMLIKSGIAAIGYDTGKGYVEDKVYYKDDSVIINPETVHTIKALSNLTIHEFGTPATTNKDVFRVEDKYSNRRTDNDLSGM